jgi:ribulose 1,5-bisphosphate synthetase/thiazole synthase
LTFYLLGANDRIKRKITEENSERRKSSEKRKRKKTIAGYSGRGACGNAVIAAHGENLMDSTVGGLNISGGLLSAAHRFTPIAWKSLS